MNLKELENLDEWNTRCYNEWEKCPEIDFQQLPYRLYVLIKFKEYLEKKNKETKHGN